MKKLLTILLLSAFILPAQAADEKLQYVTVKMLVQKGDIVNKSNLKMTPLNRKTMPAGVIDNMADVIGLEALRTLRPGMQIRYTFLRERPMVVKNKPVKVKYNVPGIVLESEAIALQDGQKEDLIKVKNIKSNKIITATVIAENVVQVK